MNTLPIRMNPTQDDINIKRMLLSNEHQYRYLLNYIIILSYMLAVIPLESITLQWSSLIFCTFPDQTSMVVNGLKNGRLRSSFTEPVE